MFKSLIDTTGYGTFAIIATVIFFVMFVIVLVSVTRLKKPYIESMERLPLDSSDSPSMEREK